MLLKMFGICLLPFCPQQLLLQENIDTAAISHGVLCKAESAPRAYQLTCMYHCHYCLAKRSTWKCQSCIKINSFNCKTWACSAQFISDPKIWSVSNACWQRKKPALFSHSLIGASPCPFPLNPPPGANFTQRGERHRGPQDTQLQEIRAHCFSGRLGREGPRWGACCPFCCAASRVGHFSSTHYPLTGPTGSPGPQGKERRQEALQHGGTANAKATRGFGDEGTGRRLRGGKCGGERRLLQVLLVLLLAKSPLTCERNAKVQDNRN